jgi:hypothetical protein
MDYSKLTNIEALMLKFHLDVLDLEPPPDFIKCHPSLFEEDSDIVDLKNYEEEN